MISITRNPSNWDKRRALVGLVSFWIIFVVFFYYVESGYIPFVDNGDPSDTISKQITTGKYIELAIKGAIVSMIALYVVRRRPSFVIRMATKSPFVLLLSCLSLASAFWSVQPARSLYSLFLFPEMAIAYGLISTFPIDRLMKSFMLYTVAVVLACFGFVAFFPTLGLQWDNGNAWRCIFYQKNICAQNLLVLLPCVMSYKTRRLSGAWGLQLILAASIMLLIGMSQSKMGWVLTLVFLGVHMILSAPIQQRTRLILFIVVAIAMVGGTAFAFVRMANVLTLLGKDSTFTGRDVIWAGAVESIGKRPLLGYGYNAFYSTNDSGEVANVIARARWGVVGAHNGFLEVAIGTGMLGAGLLTMAFLSSFGNIVRCLSKKYTAEQKWCCEVIVIVFLSGITETPWNLGSHILWFLYIFADAYLRATRSESRAVSAFLPSNGNTMHWTIGKELSKNETASNTFC